MANEAPAPKDPALLLKLLRERKKAAGGDAAENRSPGQASAIPRCDRGRPLPASFAQERLWLLDRLSPGGSAFNMPFPLRLRGKLDEAALARALAAIERRHEALRTTFQAWDEGVFQVLNEPRFRLETADLQGEPETLAARIEAEARHVFDLERGPLFRGLLLKLAPEEHVLVLTLHHVISDGWSAGVIFRELRALLAAGAAGEPAEAALPELPLQYADFAAWQRSPGWHAELARQTEYWRGRLDQAAPTLALPADRPRPAQTGSRNGTIHHWLDEPAAAALRQLASRNGCSLFMPLLTAFKILLHRLSGQEDLLVGTPVAGRGRRELEELIGIFLNTLVLRTQLSGELTFRQALLRVRDTVLGATANQDLPFEKLLIELQPERQLNQSPFFQVFFNMANIPDLRFELPGLAITFEQMPELGSKFDLNFYVIEAQQGLLLSMVYNPDLFDRARIAGMMEQLESLLEQAVADPERPVGDFDLLTPAARAALPDPRAPLPAAWPGSVADLFAARAAEQPDAVAIESRAGEVAYGELAARMEKLAARLARAGVASGEVVAIWAERSALLPEALLGILRRGAAFVVLDPAYPPARLEEFAALSRPAALLVLAGAPPIPAEAEPFLPALRLPLGPDGGGETDRGAGAHDDFAVDPDDLAYYAFTSGSTGKPKAILGGHGSLTAFLPFAASRFGLGPGDRNSLLSALSHDPLHRDVFYPLCLGMTVVIPDAEGLGSPGYLLDWVRGGRLTVLNLVPAMLQALLQEAADAAGGEAPLLPDLRRVFTVGEVLKRADVERLYALAPKVVCFNLYGSTETQRAVSFLELPRSFAFDSEDVQGPEPGSRGLQKAILPLGRGIDGVQLLVLGPRRTLAGVGELGETVFRSRFLSLGYADPAQTREKFETNPWTGDPGDRLYRTGDLGRFLPGGGVEFAGRTDFQVKIRGFRIELQEIEAALRQHPAIGEAVVLLREDEGSEKRLVAYFTSRGEAPAGRELRELLLATLPDYMVPGAFVPLEVFPVGKTGKIDRRALPAPRVEARAGRRPPLQPDQQVLAAIFGRLLGREEVFLDDHFFELGGHSLLATQLLSRVRGAFGVALPLRSIFERPTLEAFAAHLQEQRVRGGSPGARTPPLLPRPAELARRAPLSFAQQRVYFLEQLEPGSNAYLIFGALRLAGALDRAALARALGRLAARHEALRTRIGREGEEVFQEVAEAAGDPQTAGGAALGFLDFASLPAEEAERRATERAAAIAREPIPTGAAPLWRAELLRLAAEPGEHLFVLAIHHLVADGWSLGIFLRELGALYAEELGGPPAELPALPLQPADFAVWERGWLRGEALAEQLAFWRHHLEGAPAALELPADFLRPATPSHRGQRLPFVLAAPLAAGLRAFGREQGATLFMVLLAGFDVLLSQLSGQETVVVGTPVAHRDRTELEGMIGFFANTLPLRLDVEDEIGFAELVANLRRNLLDVFSHQDLPFEKLVAELGVERDLARSPVFQAFFGLQTVGGGEASWGGAALSPVEVPMGRAQFDLQWTAVEGVAGGELGGYLEWSSDLFARETVERWSRRLLRLFEQVLADPQRKLGALDVRLPEDLAFAAAFSATARPFDLARPVAWHVAENARRAPQAPALGLEGELAYTYGQLDAAAGRLALHLRRHGIGPESVAGLSIGRLPSLVVAQLAIWKAGGAYLPLDPIYPPDRLGFMFEDSGARVLLIDSRGEAAPASLLEKAGKVIDLAAEESWREEGELPPAAPGENALAYVLYTSGSTGQPKGVMIEHGALANFLLSMAEEPGLAAHDRLLSLTTMSFDISGLEIWLPLLAGARVDLAGRDTVKDPAALAAAIARTGATFVQATPATWRLLEEGGWAGAPGLVALCGGEALPGELAERLLAKVGSLWNVYGPTETTIWSALRRVKPGERLPAVVPLGAPLANTAIRILGRGGVEAAPGIAGELAIGGAGLARGYLGRPALTAEKFVPDPGGAPGSRLYRSGDLARLRMDGELEFLGRLDFQVKVRGFRIELGEIEATLEKHPAVAQAVVIAGRAPDGGSRLIAYYRPVEAEPAPPEPPPETAPPEAGPGPQPFELQAWLHRSLPDYMVPALLIRLEVFPLTPNLKVDRKALPPPSFFEARAEPRPPVLPEQQTLAAIFAGLLGADEVFLDDHFFELGGHSLLATQLIARVRSAFGVDLHLRSIFERPTLEAFAAHVLEMRGQVSSAPPLAPRPAELRRRAPLSFAQQRVFFLEELEPGANAYLLFVAWRLHGPLDRAALGRALGRLGERHEALRTRIAEVQGEGFQEIGDSPAAFGYADLSALPFAAAEAEGLARAAALAREALPLGGERLWRAELSTLGDDASGTPAHLFALAIHHLVADAWSLAVFTRELGALYAEELGGPPAALPALPVQYADFAVWERGWLRGEALEQQLAFWRKHLEGAPAALELPADRPRPASHSYRGERLAFALPGPLAERLRGFGREHGATLFMVLLAGFQALLSRLSGQRTVVVGTPVAHRDREELEGVIGFFANTLPLRLDVPPESGFAELVADLRRRLLDAFSHQHLPFEKLVAELGVERDLSRAPVFQAMFGLQNVGGSQNTGGSQNAGGEPAGGQERWGGAALSRLAVPIERSQFDLQWTALDSGEPGSPVDGLLVWSADLFARPTVERWSRRLARLFEQVMGDPERPLAALDLRLGEDRQLAAALNATARPFDLARTVESHVAETARRHSEAPALGLEGELAYTYGQLDAAASRLALHLRRHGIGPEVVAGISAGRLPSLVVGQLAIWKAGGAYLPLDPIYPPDRLRFMFEDAGAQVLLVDSRGEAAPGALRELAGTVIDLAAEASWAGETGEEMPELPVLGPHTLAYVLYTSGSTGQPKGVMIEHGALANFLLSMAEEPGLQADDRLLSLTTMSFDISGLEIWLPLLAGARVDLARRDTLADGEALAAAIAKTGATFVQATPATWRLLEDAGWNGAPDLVALCGGEALPGDLAERLLAKVGALWNVYGPTETTIWSALRRVEPGSLPAVVPLGAPIANTVVRILGPDGRETEPGTAGELTIGGAGLARGYFGRPALTAEKFVPDPAGEPGERLYRTGDLARLRLDGDLEFLGRLDFQVKVRGFRIELGEIEATLEKHPAVAQAVVAARPAPGGGTRLIGYYRLAEGAAADAAELQAALRRSLPDYMVPSLLMRLEELPLTPNLKVDRRALPEPSQEPRDLRRPPSQPDQQLLAEIFGRLLGRDEIFLDDNFFELGGHSLLATQLVARVRETFGVHPPLRALFEAPTVESFAARLRETREALPPSPPLEPRPAALRRRAPLSFAQQRLWFLEQLEPGTTAYLLFGALRLDGRLDPEALDRALGRLARRHESLRTRIVTEDGEAFQEIAGEESGAPGLLLRSVLAGGEPEEREREALARAGELAHRAIPLDAERLWSAELLRLDATEDGPAGAHGRHLFLLAIHHVVADGLSFSLFLRDLGALYREELGGGEAALPPLPVQPADFAVWERGWLHGEALERQLAFWRGHLAGAPAAIELPADFPRPATPSYRGATLPFGLPAELADRLRAFGREQSATLFMVLLAGFQALLSRLSGQRTVVVGTPVGHRERTELENVIGDFANTLPLRLESGPDDDFAALVGRLRQGLLDVFSHQDLPFEKLVGELQVERDLARTPVFQVMFGLRHAERGSGHWGEAALSLVPVPMDRAQFELQWSAIDGGAGQDLGGHLEWSTDLFERATVERWSRRLRRLLEVLVAAPRRPLASADGWLDEDRERLARLNATSRPFDLAWPVYRRVAAQAAARPDAAALGLEGELAYTYGQLDAAAGRLAALLRRHGVRRESVVGLSVGRLPSLVVAQLAVWKAGGAYLPLDPLYPPDRLAFMLEDAGARLLLVDSRDEAAPPELLAKAAAVIDLADAAAWDEESGEDEEDPADEPGGERDALAYVLYTSGSTGKPKGVMIGHGALVNFLLSMREQPGIAADDRLLSLTTMSFDISGLEIWLPLIAGARVDLARRDTLKDAAALAAAIERSGATFVQATPATWRLLEGGDWAGAPGLVALSGGEALPGELAARLRAKVGSLWNVYGPTETTIWSSLLEVGSGELPAVVPLGTPIANTAIRILGRDGLPLAPGLAGELAIGGAGLARGYFGRPALTAERFVPDPAAGEPGARLYRTGDLARLRNDGNLEFLGRLDFQVKVRGFRIELGEIEATLEKHPAVAQAVVIAGSTPAGGSRLIGYYRLADGAAAEPAELQDHLRRSLPDYMVPALLIALDVFPLTPNLKVDRKALPAPEAREGDLPRRPPESENEKILAEIWRELLKIGEVGLDDSFFALGGDSVIGILVVGQARKRGLEILPRDLFLTPTLAGLAAAARPVAATVGPRAGEGAGRRQQGVEMVGAEVSDDELADLLEDFSGG